MECAEDAPASPNAAMHRVKLYKLNTQGLWDDKGTGHVAVEWLPVRCLLAHMQRPTARCRRNVIYTSQSASTSMLCNHPLVRS